MPKVYEYSMSEGVLLRSPQGEFRVEAWWPQKGEWFRYADISKDWWESSVADPEDVPPEAAAAPSCWPEVLRA